MHDNRQTDPVRSVDRKGDGLIDQAKGSTDLSVSRSEFLHSDFINQAGRGGGVDEGDSEDD